MGKLEIREAKDIQITSASDDTIWFDFKGKHYTLFSDNNSTMLCEKGTAKGGISNLLYVCSREVRFNIDDYIFIHPRFHDDLRCADRTRFIKALEMNDLATGPFSQEWHHIKRKIKKKDDKILDLMAETIKMCDNLKEEQENLKESWLQGN